MGSIFEGLKKCLDSDECKKRLEEENKRELFLNSWKDKWIEKIHSLSSSQRELHELLHQHWVHTGSHIARTILDDWNHHISQFIQVIPIEYKKVLQDEKNRQLKERIDNLWKDI